MAQNELTDIPVPDPQRELSEMIVAEGFEVNLFAADPAIAKPIQINFDSQGRLWIVSSETYPQIKPGETSNDRVLVIEDADGDGVADETRVFADGLMIPTGIEPGDGGAYVGHSTELLHLADTDGDGRADRRRVVLSGFGTEDTHHIVHTLRWGPEGLLYFNQSIYFHSHIGTPHGVRLLNGGGIWHLRPESLELEVFARGFINTWGHHFDRYGQSFVTDGAGGQGINYLLPGAYYPTAARAERFITGLNPGSPKNWVAEIVDGRHLPEDWQGNILTNDFRANRVCRFAIREDGAGYAADKLPDLIRSTNVAFRPVDIKQGPDGAIYIADWYNPIIQHGEVDFRDERRDHVHGRIWRVTRKDRPLVQRPQLVGRPTDELLSHLAVPESWTRHQAKRVLKERGEGVLPELDRWVAQLDAADMQHDHLRLEALWLYQALDVVEPQLLTALARSSDARDRAACMRVVGHWHSRLDDAARLLAAGVSDEHPRVRLEAVRAAARIPQPESLLLVLSALEAPVDNFVDYALWLSVRELEPYWMPALRRGELAGELSPRQLEFALTAVGSPTVVEPLLVLVRAGDVSAERRSDALALAATLGDNAQLAEVLAMVVDPQQWAHPPDRARVLMALVQAARERDVRPDGDLSAVEALLDADEPQLVAAAIAAAGAWNCEPLTSRVVDMARAAETDLVIRRAALEALVTLGGGSQRSVLEELSESSQPALVREQAIVALAGVDLRAAAAAAATLLAEAPPRNPAALITAFLERRKGAQLLAAAIGELTMDADTAKLALRAVQSAGREAPLLVAALRGAGGLTQPSGPPTPEEVLQLAQEIADHGDAARGEAVLRRSELACFKCHGLGGAGGRVGPDLSTIGASAPIDYVIESLLAPAKAVKEGYHSLIVTTDEGRIVTGIPVRRNDQELILRDAEDRELRIPAASIDDEAPGQSMMPTGLTDTLTRGELVDLLRYMTELGKPGAYAVDPQSWVRRWRVLPATPEVTKALRRKSLELAAEDEGQLPWQPLYSNAAGALPLDELPALSIRGDFPVVAVVRFEIDVSMPGAIELDFGDRAGLSVWLDRQPLPEAGDWSIECSAGRHRVTVAVTLSQRETPLACQVRAPPGSSTRVQAVTGK